MNIKNENFQYENQNDNTSKAKVYNKLVRDKIPEIIENSGRYCEIEVMDDLQYAEKLTEKLCEEVQEFLKEFNAENDENAIKELADILEVIYAIVELIGVTVQDFEKIRLAKVDKNGNFSKKILLKSIMNIGN